MFRIAPAFAFGLSLLLVGGEAGCTDGDQAMPHNVDKARSEEIRRLIASELVSGASAQAIEEFFVRNKIAYSYDRFAHRYQATIRDVSSDPRVDQAVSILIYVDDQKRFVKAEVDDTFTAP